MAGPPQYLLGRGHLVPDAFGDDLPFVLGEGDQNTQEHAPGRVGGVEVLGDRDEADPLLVEALDHLHEVEQRPRQAVDLVDHDHVHLPRIHVELVETVRGNVTIDWTLRENVRANLRRLVRRILRKHGYPPDKQEKATRTVLEQAEVLSQGWAAPRS